MKKFLIGTAASAVLLAAMAIPVFAGNPSDDGDCAETVTDPFLGLGTRADLYNCKAVGNSGEEQGVYFWDDAPAATVGYPADYGTCDIVVKWSGDFGGTPYLDFGNVYNRTMCSNGYVEVWGDQFNPPSDPWGATPYVYTIGGEGDQVHNQNPN